MKLLTIIYDASIDTSLMRLLEELEAPAWTKTFQLFGEGEAGIKLNTPVWPGTNNQILLAGEEDLLRSIASRIREMQAEFKLRPGIFMCLTDIQEI